MQHTIDERIFESSMQLFEEHLNLPYNQRIVFSGKYGTGKTTFLKHFFRQNQGKYNVVHLYPVNYSVGSSSDIFKYIKFDILCELLATVDWESHKFDISETEISFFKANSSEIISAILYSVAAICKISPEVIKQIKSLRNKFLAHKNEDRDEEFSEVDQLIQDLNVDGSIYEFNFTTELIIDLLKSHKNDEALKENILIVDDLDRIDPAHIFRLLNVFSAHFDLTKSEVEGANKFGFDKVIFVCDAENIRQMFTKFYGQSFDYSGYLDKFYCKYVYDFNVRKDVLNTLYGLIAAWAKDFDDESAIRKEVGFVIEVLINNNQINLRSLFRLKELGYRPDNIFFPGGLIGEQYTFYTLSFMSLMVGLLGDKHKLFAVVQNSVKFPVNNLPLDIFLSVNYLFNELIVLATLTKHEFEIGKSVAEIYTNANVKVSYTLSKINHANTRKSYLTPKNLKVTNIDGEEIGEKTCFFFFWNEAIVQLEHLDWL